MKSTRRPILAASLMLVLTGCTVFGGSNRRPIVLAADASCTELVPSAWEEGVAHAPDPAPAPPAPVAPAAGAPESARTDYWRAMYEWSMGELRKWASFGVAEAQVVEAANGRTRDTRTITRGCEQRDAAAVRRAAR